MTFVPQRSGPEGVRQRNDKGMEDIMTKTLAALATAAALAVGTLAVPNKADAGCYGCAVGAGVLAGALIGSAIAANSGPYYGGGYYAPAPVYAGPCSWQNQRYWDGFGWNFRRVRVCY